MLYSQIVREKFVYEILLENNKSKVLTRMKVYALSMDDAKNQVALNGWSVLDIKEIPKENNAMFKSNNKNEIKLNEESIRYDSTPKIKTFLHDNTSNQEDALQSENRLLDNRRNDIGIDNISISSVRREIDTNYQDTKISKDNISEKMFIEKELPVSQDNVIMPADEILPNDSRIQLVSTMYFDLGDVNNNGKIKGVKIADLDKGKMYVVFGNADEVNVVPNSQYNNNFDLSYKRALFIRNEMNKAGLIESNIKAYGLGTKFLAVDVNGSNELNRRVDIYEFR